MVSLRCQTDRKVAQVNHRKMTAFGKRILKWNSTIPSPRNDQVNGSPSPLPHPSLPRPSLAGPCDSCRWVSFKSRLCPLPINSPSPQTVMQGPHPSHLTFLQNLPQEGLEKPRSCRPRIRDATGEVSISHFSQPGRSANLF